MSKDVWIAELQNAKGKTIEYHGIDLVPEKYPDRRSWNAAHRSWYWFRQRERSLRGKAPYSTYWFQPDDPLFLMSKPEVTYHETIWDLYTAIGYDYKRQLYIRQPEGEQA